MDYSQGFIDVIFVVLLLYSSLEGALKLNLRHSAPFAICFYMVSIFIEFRKFSASGPKTWTIILRRFDRN